MSVPKTREEKIKEENDRINGLINKTAPVAAQDAAGGDVVPREGAKVEDQPSGITPIQPAPQAAKPNTGDDPNSETWQQRFTVLDGKYRNEVPRLHARNKELEATLATQKEQILRLEGKVDALSSGRQETSPTGGKQTEANEDLLEKEYGKELGEGVDQRIEKRMKETLARLDKIEQSTVQTQTGDFYKDLDGLAAGWEQKNTDPSFLDFIRKNGPAGTDDTYSTLLNKAFEARNSLRVSEIFNLFGGAAPAQQQVVDDPLEGQLVPGRGRGGEAQTGEKATAVSRADIQEFYRKVQAAPHRYSEEDIARFERKVEQAVKSGNVN